MIAALYGESVICSEGQIQNGRIEKEDVYVELGGDHPEKIEK